MTVRHAIFPLLLLAALSPSCERHQPAAPEANEPAQPVAPAPPAPEPPPPSAATVRIAVDPHTTRSIAGHPMLDRNRYFAICDSGRNFEQRVGDPDRYDYLVNELGIRFGRDLGLVSGLSKDTKLVREDPARAGFAEVEPLRKHLAGLRREPSPLMLTDFGPNLDVALHGQHKAWPEFMGVYLSEWLKEQEQAGKPAPDHLPENVEAAAELAATVLKHGYNDFTRPRYYEPINEPHWSFMTEPEHLARWHLVTRNRLHAELPGVLVGGPCNSVGHLYSQDYRSFRGIRNFIDATAGMLDFYSFHVYDYYRAWDQDHFAGAILSGLPLEGVLDLVPNYTFLNYGKETPIVVSEHGGYLPADSESGRKTHIEELAARHVPGSGFEREMKVRSIHDFIQVSSTIANTLAFMDHPHVVAKAVPFMLLETSAWDPEYYAALYVRENFDKESGNWIPSGLHHFYQLFAGFGGRRVPATCTDPDIQLRACVDGNRLFIAAHNLATKPEVLWIDAPPPGAVAIRRYGRNDDFTPFLSVQTATRLDAISLGPRETVVVVAVYDQAIESRRTLEESIHYGQAVTVPVEESAQIRIPTRNHDGIESATLRIGYNRPAGCSPDLEVLLNGSVLEVPLEDSAARYDHEKHGYSTTKLIPVDPDLLEALNTVTISFPDGGKGTIGSAVLRVAR